MSCHTDGLGPVGNIPDNKHEECNKTITLVDVVMGDDTEHDKIPGNVSSNDWFSEQGAANNVPDGGVGRCPHVLEVVLLHLGHGGGDGRTLDTGTKLQNRSGNKGRN